MSALVDGRKHRSLVEAISQWWRDWTGNGSALSELKCYAEDEVQRLAKDVGVSVSELRGLARFGPDAADLLLRRMAALDLDRNEVSQAQRQTFQDLQRVCTMCKSHRRCARDIARDSADAAWEEYCPNVATLKALNAMPWAARREW